MKVLSLLGITAGLLTTQGATLFSDDFTYPNGPLVRVSTGKWKTHSGTAEQTEVVNGQLTLSQKHSEDLSGIFPAGPASKTNTIALYASFKIAFLALPSGANGAYFAHFKDANATAGFRCRIFASTNKAAQDCFRLGIASGSNAATAWWPENLRLRAGYRVMCRMRLADNACTLWLNPVSEDSPAVNAEDLPTPRIVTAFAFRQTLASGSGMGELLVDNLRVATQFGETVAETDEIPLGIRLTDAAVIELSWPADPTKTYSVWSADSLPDNFTLLAGDLWWDGGSGLYEEPAYGISRFYRISTP